MANVFLLAKYGYRLDIGISLMGISLGWEMGIGACIAQGGLDFKTQIGNDYGSNSFSSEGLGIGVMLDTAVEAAIRLGKNFRLIARLGAMLTPLVFSDGDSSGFWGMTGTYTAGDADALITRYDIDQIPIIPPSGSVSSSTINSGIAFHALSTRLLSPPERAFNIPQDSALAPPRLNVEIPLFFALFT